MKRQTTDDRRPMTDVAPRTLPDGWKQARLGDAFPVTKKPTKLRYENFLQIPFVPMDLIPIGELFFDKFLLKTPQELTSGTYFEPGDVLVAKITPSFENGKQGIIPDLPTPFGIATTEVIPLKDVEGISDRFFLFYNLLRGAVRTELAGKMEGSTGRQRLSKSTLENLLVSLPPLPEQRAIAYALRTVQQARAARQRELTLERERKAALMEHLFTHGTRNEPRKRTEIGEMPESWRVVKLGDVCEFLQYGTSKQCNLDSSGIPVLRIPNVIGGKIDTSELKFIKLQRREADGLRLEVGDLIFVRTNGRREYTGRCAVYKGELGETLFASYLIRARLQSQTLIPEFVRIYTELPEGRQYLSGRASHAADGKFNINTQTIKGVIVPIPLIEEQQIIVETIEACNAKIAALEREAQVLDELFRAMLDELMTGRLRLTTLVRK